MALTRLVRVPRHVDPLRSFRQRAHSPFNRAIDRTLLFPFRDGPEGLSTAGSWGTWEAGTVRSGQLNTAARMHA